MAYTLCLQLSCIMPVYNMLLHFYTNIVVWDWIEPDVRARTHTQRVPDSPVTLSLTICPETGRWAGAA